MTRKTFTSYGMRYATRYGVRDARNLYSSLDPDTKRKIEAAALWVIKDLVSDYAPEKLTEIAGIPDSPVTKVFIGRALDQIFDHLQDTDKSSEEENYAKEVVVGLVKEGTLLNTHPIP